MSGPANETNFRNEIVLYSKPPERCKCPTCDPPGPIRAAIKTLVFELAVRLVVAIVPRAKVVVHSNTPIPGGPAKQETPGGYH